jgi:uncharacterized repeat protein (TIGR01451 family)
MFGAACRHQILQGKIKMRLTGPQLHFLYRKHKLTPQRPWGIFPLLIALAVCLSVPIRAFSVQGAGLTASTAVLSPVSTLLPHLGLNRCSAYPPIVDGSRSWCSGGIGQAAHNEGLLFAQDADLEMIVTAQNPRFVPGGVVVYVLTVINHGPSDATGVVVSDMPPGEVSFVSAVPTPDIDDNGMLAWNLGVLNAGQQSDIWLTVDVDVAVTTPFANSAQVDCPSGDVELTNNEDSYTVQPNEPTAVDLLYFRAAPRQPDSALVEWAVAAERDGFGYRLVRAAVNDFAQAEEVFYTPAKLPNGEYQYTDTLSHPGDWWYWLVKIHNTGKEEASQPILLTLPIAGERQRMYLPSVWR